MFLRSQKADFLSKILNIPLKELLNASQSWSIQWVFGSHIILYETIKTKTAKKKRKRIEKTAACINNTIKSLNCIRHEIILIFEVLKEVSVWEYTDIPHQL